MHCPAGGRRKHLSQGFTVLLVAAVARCMLLGRPLLAAEDERVVARAHYEAATRYYDIREYAKALEEYKAAYLAKPDPAFLFNIGQCYRLMGKPAEALDFFRQYLKKSPVDDPVRPQIEARVRSLEEEESQLGRNSRARAGVVSSQSATTGTAPSPAAEASTAPPSAAGSTPPAQVPSPTYRPAGIELRESLPTKETPSPPVYKRWWFWTGVSALVLAGGVTAVFLASGGGGTQIPSTTLGTASAFR